MSNIYCGNNKKDGNLLSCRKIIGTRYACFKKGVGVGLNLPEDPKYKQNYEAIDKRKIYCGKKNTLPPGYDYMGNLPQCLQKGVGVGKLKKARQI